VSAFVEIATVCELRQRLSLIGVFVLSIAPGCANDGQQQRDAGTPATAAGGEQPSTAVTSETPSGDTFVATTEVVSPPSPIDPVVLRDVRAAGQTTFDRVVFEFATAPLPGYRIAYADDPVRDCGSGETVNVRGASRLTVRLSPAQAHTEQGIATVKELERHLALPVLQELELTCDFEADVSWVLGLAARRPYRVSELAAPPRLVVDIQH
jgi:hypothetical protein